ncbi:MAG: DUF2520 domain-containing protein [Verrucomicrobia bacterium]|nr:DUF2520 domain-containing protein [Verrucomicrobiota bacterium]
MMKNVDRIIFVGAGNLATNLALALREKGYAVEQIYSQTESSARTLADRVQAAWTTELEKLIPDADLYIVSLKDTALVELLPEIVKGRESRFFVHTAGSIPIDLWKTVPGLEHYGVLYPMQTFSKARRVSFENIPVFIEAGTPEDVEVLTCLAKTLSRNVQTVNSAQRQALHLAAVFACNFTNHCYTLSEKILAENGLSFDVMLPLIEETTAKLRQLSPRAAQTGPAVRYDTNVMDKHIAALSGHPEWQTLYRLMSRSIHREAEEGKRIIPG